MPEAVIETLDDWNSRLLDCGCCPMPECLTPTKECQSVFGEYNSEIDAEITGGLYLTYEIEVEYENCTDTLSASYDYLIQGGIGAYEIDPPTLTITGESCDPDTRGAYIGSTYTGLTAYTPAMFLTDALTYQNAHASFTDPDNITVYNTPCFSSVTGNNEFGQAIYSLDICTNRFRWKVPDAHTGTYFKITWDVLNEPTGWDSTPPTATRTYFAEDQTFVWNGTAGGGTDRYSEWYRITVPNFVGTRRIVNVRYECYGTTNYGNKPQVTGEAVTLPDT